MKYDLSILIPARNEEWLNKTIEDILANIEGKTEIIVVLDGYFVEIPQNPRVSVIYNPVSLGQRAATNQAAKLSEAKYLAKCDAYCAFDKGFDVKMMSEMHDDWTMVPTMRNLHVFDWVCPNGHRRYQSPSGACLECKAETSKEIIWKAKKSPQSNSYCFDNTPHFQYFKEFEKREEGKGDITPSMSLQGSFFMLTREKYWELGICDEAFGSWGSQGIEVAVKTWLSGGRVMVNKKTWYAHLFRTQGGDFGFPYEQSGRQVDAAKRHAKELFFDNKWDKQIYPLSYLLEKFWPVPGWSEEDLNILRACPLPNSLSKGAIYYTDNRLDQGIMKACQVNLGNSFKGKIVSSSLQPIGFGDNIHLPLERGYLTMAKQILAALERLDTDIVFFTEHDVLYHPSHFDFTPTRKDVYFYNTNVWKLRLSDGHLMRTNDCRQLSGLCCFRELALQHFRERVRRIEAEGFSRAMGFEPGTHNRKERIDDYKSDRWESAFPNIDIRHDNNLTPSRWKKEQFRNQKYTEGWQEAEKVIGWDNLSGIIKI